MWIIYVDFLIVLYFSKSPSSFSKTLTSSYSAATTGTSSKSSIKAPSSSLSSTYKIPGTVSSISYNGSPATAAYAPEKKSAKLENEIESADTAEQRSDVAPTYQVKSSYIQGIGPKKSYGKKVMKMSTANYFKRNKIMNFYPKIINKYDFISHYFFQRT